MLQKVATTGVDLDSTYTQTLQRIKDQKGDRSRLGIEVLMWVSHAERPLRIDELRHALAVEMGSTDLDPDNIPPQDTVLGSCLGLAVVDAETSTVRLIHYTLQEYLSSPGIMPDAHKALGQTCLTYLNYKQVKELPAKKISNFEDIPFLKYSSLHWGSHAKVELSDYAKSLALELLNLAGNHISATLLIERVIGTWGLHSCSLPYHLWPSLHCASHFGIIEVMAALIERGGSGINQRDCISFTPLLHAAQQGNEGVVQLLLTRDDINPDNPDIRGKTPLWWASLNGHEGVVKMLLARNDVNPNKPDNFFRKTPLLCASEYGHEGIVKLLLKRDDVNPNMPKYLDQTPLWWASQFGRQGVVRLLLAHKDLDPNSIYEAYQMLTSFSRHSEAAALLQPRATSVSELVSKQE